VQQVSGLTYEVVPSGLTGLGLSFPTLGLPTDWSNWATVAAEIAVALVVMQALLPVPRKGAWRRYAAAVAVALLIRQVDRSLQS
jgi:hypothetical protein